MKSGMLAFAIAVSAIGAAAASGDLDLAAMMQPLPATAVLREEGYFVWGGSMVKGEDGLYHIFYSRWPKGTYFSGWVTHSEIAHATAPSPAGPWTHRGVALPKRGAEFWDGMCTHNPCIRKFDGKYYLYYMGNTGDGKAMKNLNWTHRNNQRIGVAVAKSPSGPWQRADKPLIDVSADKSAPDSLMVSNPAITRHPDGTYEMVYKAVGQQKKLPFGGPVVHLSATSKSPTGPFVKNLKPIFTDGVSHFPAEDPCMFTLGGKVYTIIKDQGGYFVKQKGRSLVLFEADGKGGWKLAPHALITGTSITHESGEVQPLAYLERPQLYIEDGKPVALCCAAGTSDMKETFNVQIPLAPRPKAASAFSHEMPKGTNERPLDTPYAEMAETFRNPFDKVQTGCYWYWMAGNVSCDGVRKDLEAMKKAGIDRPYIGDIGGGGNEQGPVKTFSPEWNEVLQTAFSTASRLGIEIGLFNSPGWSQSGGPWVKPEMAMRRVVSSVVVVDGPSDGVVLPAPKFEYAPQKDMRDVCAIAYPVPKGLDGRLEKRAAKDAPLEAAKDKPLVVEFASPEPFEAQSAELVLKSGKGCGDVVVEAEVGGEWKRICKMPYSRYNHGPGVGFAPHAPIFAAFAPTTAKRFRVTVSTTRTDAAAGFASVAVCAAPRVERAVEKSLGKMHETPLPMWKEYKWPVEMECAEKTALDPSKAVVLTGKVAPDGKLDWKVPAGTWAIYRIACAPTGTKNGPANPEATGYEVDKMSREHIAAHFDAYLGKILEATPPESRKAIRHAVLDSYEQGGQNFTDHFAEKFKASFGYDPTPYLPVLNGMAVGSRADSDRFLWDLRRFVADEVAYSYVGGLRKASNAHGMETWLECYGHWGFPGEFLQYGGQSDGIAGEYWCEGSLGDIENRAASSCAHIYGRRLVWAESNTSGHKWFERGPMDLKQRTDRFFAEGLNATILHVYIQQESDRKPGRIAWFGNEFNRHNTWFEHFDLYTGYLKRCGWMLRQGLNVADVAYFIGEDTPCMTGVCDPALPAGRQFDYINAEVLTETAGVDEKGRIVLPHGTAYEVLVLPKLDTMRPKMAECVERLVNVGATVVGPRPTRSPSLAGQPESDAKVREIAERLWGGGKISSSMTLEEALAKRKSEPDVVFDAKRKLAYAHRTMPKAEIYFVSNQSGEAMPSVDVSFRIAGRTPELWDAATGESRAAGNWREDKGRTSVTLSLAKHESVFVVFPAESSRGGAETRSSTLCGPAAQSEMNIAGPWTVEFESDELHRGPKEPVKFDRLVDLSTSDDPAIKHYSGKLVYRTKFNVPSSLFPLSSSLSLDLGEVSVTAKVKVNGKDAGGVCFAPYRLDIAPFVKAGENDLEIEVCNRWVNRLVGDDGDPNRPTWTSIPCCSRGMRLPKSGLLGPVSIR